MNSSGSGRVQAPAVVSTALNVRPYKTENFLTSCVSTSFSRRTLLNEVSYSDVLVIGEADYASSSNIQCNYMYVTYCETCTRDGQHKNREMQPRSDRDSNQRTLLTLCGHSDRYHGDYESLSGTQILTPDKVIS